MKYVIRITKIEEKTVTKRGDHTVIKERPWTSDEVDSKTVCETKENFLKRNPVKKIYGYAPSWQGVEKEETEVLKQTVDELDLPAVIKAVNGL